MKTKNQIVKGLAVLLLLIASAMGAMAQTNTSLTQDVCPGPEPYRVEVIPDTGNDYLWTVTGSGFTAIEGTDYTFSNTATESTTKPNIIIKWANPVAPKKFNVFFKERDPVTECYDEVNVEVTVNPTPAPAITGVLTVCQNVTGVTYSTPNVDGNTYSWLVSGGFVTAGSGTNEITVTWDTAGPGTVEVTETVTATTCATTVSIPVIVNPTPAPVITGLAAVCQDQAGVIYSTPNDAANTYSWVVTGGTVTAGAGTNEITVTWNTVGSGTVEVMESVTSTTCATTVNIPVIVNPAPAPVITGLAAVCQDQAGVTYSTPNDAANTYSWVVTGGTVTAGAGTNEITVTWDTVGSGTVEVTEKVTATTCATTVNIPVIINPIPNTSLIYHN